MLFGYFMLIQEEMRMKFYVGTSGWRYFWNKEGSFKWFVENSGLNAVELNASFYCFPFPNMIRSWARNGRSLRWSIKVNRLITHQFKFGDKALELWRKFRNLFSPMDELIDFYLFQLPPFMTPKYASRIERFIEKVRLDERFALEVRNVEWFNERWFRWASCYGITWVSVDSPDLPREILSTNGKVYVRMHGRTSWYNHVYTDEELSDVLLRILLIKPRKVYIFFNNDHGMLVNARRALELYRKINDQQMKRE